MNATRKLREAWAVYGHLWCEECECRVDLSDADTLEAARDIAIDHHKEEH